MKTRSIAAVAALLLATGAAAQELSDPREQAVRDAISRQMPPLMGVGSLKVRSLDAAGDTVKVDVSENMGDVPFTRQGIDALKSEISALYDNRPVRLTIVGNDIEKYYCDFEPQYRRVHAPFITHAGQAPAALDGKIIATWPSHGWYFEPKLDRWEWQRARLLQTVEDMYTHSYIIPFLMPMLENAGAYVWDARERDIHNFGAVVDADKGLAQATVKERNGKRKWHAGDGAGFAYARASYRNFENPFAEGTYRMVDACRAGEKASTMSYSVTMPQAGDFAVYISYKTLPASATAVQYTVNSLSGADRYVVNQQMGGGTWVYLGTFPLAAGLNKDVVVVSNEGCAPGTVVTSDAVRVGGGKGNIERRVALPTPENRAIAARHEDEKYLGKEGVDYQWKGSGDHPWFHLGARYYLQWAGFPDSVYSTSEGINDYVDDYRSRGEWVNYLAGGSEVLPNHKGLNVPVDVSFCLHTDAGNTGTDSIVGTLLIYSTKKNGEMFGTYENGTPRTISRQFADMVSTHVCNDIRAKYEPKWMRRGMWDKAYYEARVPEVPALLMELLSHHNFADMRYGLDPQFRFDISRSIYKGILDFIAARDGFKAVVQPLPVSRFLIAPVQKTGEYVLSWLPTPDSLVADGAMPTAYQVLERTDATGAFRVIATVTGTSHRVTIPAGEMRSYRVVALNDGGRSFPSETLSAGAPKGTPRGTVMVVNGFTRVSAPDWFDSRDSAGFDDNKDHGMPYMQQINYLGSQYEFRRKVDWRDDDAPGVGACRSDHETEVIAGNTFDYPAVHGRALMAAGYAFVSASAAAVDEGFISLEKFDVIDLAMGKQKQVKTGRGAMPDRYTAFPAGLRKAVATAAAKGVGVLLSGSYVGTDIWDNVSDTVDKDAAEWAETVMGYVYLNGRAALDGNIVTVTSPMEKKIPVGMKAHFVNRLNDRFYAVESPDAIKASDERGATIARYSENNLPAAIASDRGTHRTVVFGFPLETVTDQGQLNALVKAALDYVR